ncbi:MAG: divalent metal cation transporter [Desulfuromonadales bacterium]
MGLPSEFKGKEAQMKEEEFDLNPNGSVAVRSREKSSRSNLWKAIGPGILVACAAVGGSHLVWSTRAGAEFGWSLLGLILLANLFKFPFFLYGQRYTAATGESLLAGYRRKGIGYVWVFLLVNILTGTINIAGVAMLSGALFAGYGFTGMEIRGITVAILLVCMAGILLGQYKLLDGIAKIVVIVLSLTTFVAVALALPPSSGLAPGHGVPLPFW